MKSSQIVKKSNLFVFVQVYRKDFKMAKAEHKSMIKVRGGFSDDMGFNPCNTQPQTAEFDHRTRTFISNSLYDFLQIVFEHEVETRNLRYGLSDQNLSTVFCKDLIQNVFADSNHLPIGYRYNWENLYPSIEKVIMEAPYNEVLDLLWYICYWLSVATNKCFNIFQKRFNDLFEREYVGYRFITGKIVPITDKIEMQEIEKAVQTPFEGARAQLQKALGFLSDREHPDYKNCVKESISAVESVCKVLANDPKAELGKALKSLIANGLNIHGSLKSAILALYGYASDEGGIRHAERETESTVTFEEAKFMMVTCSAIVNYLVAEYGKHGAENA